MNRPPSDIFVRRVTRRRCLLVVLLAIALLPLSSPSGSTGGPGTPRGGATAERSTSHPAITSLSESWAGMSVPPRSAHSHEALQCTVGRRLSLLAEHELRRHRSSPDVLGQGTALVPLRL